MLVALTDHLGEQVEGAGRDHHVVDLLHLRELVGDRLELTHRLDPDHRLAGEAELERIGHRDHLHHTAVGQPLDALTDCCLGQADHLADGRVGAAAVLLELLDDCLGDCVELDDAVAVCPR